MNRIVLKAVLLVAAVLAMVVPVKADPVELWISHEIPGGGANDVIKRVRFTGYLTGTGTLFGEIPGFTDVRRANQRTDLNRVLVSNNAGPGNVVELDRDGNVLTSPFLTSIGTLGFSQTPIDRGSNIIVQDQAGDIVQYNSAGGSPSTLLSRGGSTLPTDMRVAPNGNIILADPGTSQLLRYNANGTPHGTQPVIATLPGFTPQAIAFGPDDRLYVQINNGTFDIRRYELVGGLYTFLDTFNFDAGGGQVMEFGPDGNLYVDVVARQIHQIAGPFHATPGVDLGVFYTRNAEETGSFRSITWMVPEPASLALLGLGGLMMLRRRRA